MSRRAVHEAVSPAFLSTIKEGQRDTRQNGLRVSHRSDEDTLCVANYIRTHETFMSSFMLPHSMHLYFISSLMYCAALEM